MLLQLILLLVIIHFLVGILCALYFIWQIHLENKKYGTVEKIWTRENIKVLNRIVLYGYVSVFVIVAVEAFHDEYDD